MFFLLALLYERAKMKEKALESMKSLLRLNPNSASALNYIGYTYADRGEKLDKAQEMIERALHLKPDDGFVTDSLGWLFFKKGEYEKALKILLKANSMAPGEPAILEHIADTYLATGDRKEAKKYFQKALDLESSKENHDDETVERLGKKLEELEK
jgi:tetratricopeptide (TPR) repeat protein